MSLVDLPKSTTDESGFCRFMLTFSWVAAYSTDDGDDSDEDESSL